MKKGDLHDDAREEIEIKFEIDDFDKLKSLFLALGYDVEIVRLRKRIQFDRDGIEVSLDDTA
jgi:adenylate cyclase class IV